jgi:hypothetical protein
VGVGLESEVSALRDLVLDCRVGELVEEENGDGGKLALLRAPLGMDVRLDWSVISGWDLLRCKGY